MLKLHRIRRMDHGQLCDLGADYKSAYSDKGFWKKVKKVASKVSRSVLEPALKLYYAGLDKDTPAWAKTVIFGALGYFIFPVDLIPDAVPVVGYADDLAVIGAALATVASHVKEEHTRRAREVCNQWL